MTQPSVPEVRAAVAQARGESERFLCDLIRFPSVSGQEQGVMEYVAQRFSELGEVERVPLSNTLREDEDYADPLPGLDYEGRFNVRFRRPGSGGGKTLLFNTHLDVVPASAGQPRPFDPTVEDGLVRGRGACDAKGQAAALFTVLLALQRLGVQLKGDVLAHLVVEEEVGGNGTLAMVRRGERADACITMEPTGLSIMTSSRGAVWFRVVLTGKPGHSGRAGDTVSALKMAIRVIEILERYHAHLLGSSRGIPLFDGFANPMPITFGKLVAGDWPSAAPASAVVEGVLGFLPNKTRCEVMDEIRQAILEGGDEWLREHFTLAFTYRHDSQVLEPDHALPMALLDASQLAGAAGVISAMTASSDSWFYQNQLQIPTVVFGPGSIGFAHGRDEQIHLDEIGTAAVILAGTIGEWCG